mmetsp:Transcript_13659/g.22351  ORF Transcript_13659/g.22351 Transcript_13659/m.22351 type:complete len:201 (-) Transcript_13659:27-629(-)
MPRRVLVHPVGETLDIVDVLHRLLAQHLLLLVAVLAPEGAVQARARRLERLGRGDGLLRGVRGDLVRGVGDGDHLLLGGLGSTRWAEGQHYVGSDGRGEPGGGGREAKGGGAAGEVGASATAAVIQARLHRALLWPLHRRVRRCLGRGLMLMGLRGAPRAIGAVIRPDRARHREGGGVHRGGGNHRLEHVVLGRAGSVSL